MAEPLNVRTIRDDHDLITRLDERMRLVEAGLSDVETDLGVRYVTRAEFWPVRTVVYSLVGLILTSVFAGLLALVVRS